MNTRQFLLKTTVLLCTLLNNTVLLSMKSDYNKKFNNKPQTNLPVEMIEGVAAYASDSIKDIMKQTCHYFRFAISQTNINFVSHPLFTTSEQNIQKMVLYNSWYNNALILNALRKHMRDTMIIIPIFAECDNSGTGITYKDKKIAIDLPGKLNQEYNNDNRWCISKTPQKIKSEIDLAIHCAIVCDDTKAIKNLVPKIKDLYSSVHGYGRQEVQKTLMMLLAKRGNKQAFEFMIIHDPYRMKEYHHLGQHFYENTLLDRLNKSTDENMNIYKAICIQYGEKTSSDVTPNSCTIL